MSEPKPGQEPLKGRQETFSQIHSKGDQSAAESFRQAGYSPNGANKLSSRLMAKDGIKARIAYLRAKWAEKHEVTRESLAQEYDAAYEVGKLQDNAAGMVAGTTGKAKLYGLYIDKSLSETTKTQQELTADEQHQAKLMAEFILWRGRQDSIKLRRGHGSASDGRGAVNAAIGDNVAHTGTGSVVRFSEGPKPPNGVAATI